MTNIIAGLAGAVALNIIHQTIKCFDDDAPRVDLVGEEVLTESMLSLGLMPLTGNALFAATFAGDIFSNTLYYSTIGFAKNKFILLTGTLVGLTAGIGALELPGPMGLSDAPVNRTEKTKLLTVALYTIGGLVSAISLKVLRKRSL
ncbi:hypothetical protein [Mucilaginibacter agri]|nr:hypothetical protein [Mucilaginibacter agri]